MSSTEGRSAEDTGHDGSPCSGQEIRAEYVRHFLSDEFVVGREKEARLFKSIIDTITAEDVQQVAEQLRSSASCVVKAVSHRRHASGCTLNPSHSSSQALAAGHATWTDSDRAQRQCQCEGTTGCV